MSYELLLNGDEQDYMGCLDCLHDHLGDGGYGSARIDLYSGADSDISDEQLEACRLVAMALPVTLWQSAKERDEVIETGLLHVTQRTRSIALHARLAPFRLFIENEHSCKFFHAAKEYDVIGAWIAAHFYRHSDLISYSAGRETYIIQEGYHQSMFPTPRMLDYETLEDAYLQRRIAALYPKYRCLLPGDPIICKNYVIPALDHKTQDILQEALDFSTHKYPEEATDRDLPVIVAQMKEWHDKVCKALDKVLASRKDKKGAV